MAEGEGFTLCSDTVTHPSNKFKASFFGTPCRFEAFPLDQCQFSEEDWWSGPSWSGEGRKARMGEKCPATYLVRPSKASGWILLILLSYNVNLVTCILNHNCNQGQTECQILSSNRGACQKLFCVFFPLRGYTHPAPCRLFRIFFSAISQWWWRGVILLCRLPRSPLLSCHQFNRNLIVHNLAQLVSPKGE